MKGSSNMQEEMLRKLAKQAEGYDEERLRAGLTVLAKDVAEYLAATAQSGKDVQLFQEVYLTALNRERAYWEKHGPQLFLPLDQTEPKLPSGFAQAAVKGDPDISSLGGADIIHEWTKFPGRDLLERFAGKFKETICGKDGPYEQFNNGLIGQADLPTKIAAAILIVGLSAAAFWYPLAVYIGLLLAKASLKTYCEAGEVKFEPEAG
jgi:hypothetical protein